MLGGELRDGRFSEAAKCFAIEAVVACALGAQTVHSHCSPCLRAVGETLGPDRNPGSWVLARAGAHFLSDAEKCCVSLLFAHCRVFGFRSRPARRSVSRAQFSVSRKWLLASLGLPEPADFDVREATSQAQKLGKIVKLVDDFLIFQPTGCLGQCATLF